MTRSLEEPLCCELYTIDVTDDVVSMSSITRYSWDIPKHTTSLTEIYACLICDHNRFDFIDHEGIVYFYEHEHLYQCFMNDKGRWTPNDTSAINCVVDFNVYNNKLYVLRYNKDEGFFALYSGNDINDAECISTFELPGVYYNARLLVSDGYICIISDTDIYTIPI